MKLKVIFFFICFLPFIQSYSQIKIDFGFEVYSGYTFNTTKSIDLPVLQAEPDNSIPGGFGFVARYKLQNKLMIIAKTQLDYSTIVLNYNDLEAYASRGENSQILPSLSFYRKKDDFLIPSINVPLGIQYYLLKKMYLSGSAGIQYLFNKSVKQSTSFYYTFGVGYTGERFGWELSLREPIQLYQFNLPDQFINQNYQNPMVTILNRSLVFAFSYKLWSK